ncbi:hypothetical protein IHE44_0014660 [Lamprotornis superbus]|uniref:TNFAIP6 n=1 Tax=Lamprotornis superbus TaxID=245042 RepID=A0A835TNK9_9PASS|nr:hypothetical protein IHE44_0014660 [Lamprotornis superbus]
MQLPSQHKQKDEINVLYQYLLFPGRIPAGIGDVPALLGCNKIKFNSFHVCAAGWMAKGRVGYPIVKAGANCGFGKTGIVDYGIRLNRSERWDAYCYNPNGKECGGVFTDSKHVFRSPGYPNEYENEQICYWHIRVRYGHRIRLQFLEFDVEEDTACLADFLEVYDSYDDINGFVGRFCGDELPDDIISTAGGFQIRYSSLDTATGSNATSPGKNNFLPGKFGIISPTALEENKIRKEENKEGRE